MGKKIENMEFRQVVLKRFSMRQYYPAEVPESMVREIIELSKFAPSAGNMQSYKVAITKEKVTNIDAPLNLVICADLERSARRYGDRGRNFYAIQDPTIFGAYLQLAIVDNGLASAWVGAFKESGIRNLLKLPEHLKPIAVIPMGYPIGEKSGRRRRSFEEIVWHTK